MSLINTRLSQSKTDTKTVRGHYFSLSCSPSQHKSQAEKVASVAGFISELQDSLSDEGFRKFKQALAAYIKGLIPPSRVCEHWRDVTLYSLVQQS